MEEIVGQIFVQVLDSFLSSSSSSSDDEDELQRKCNCRIIPRIRNYIETVVNNYNDLEFMQNFRFYNLLLL